MLYNIIVWLIISSIAVSNTTLQEVKEELCGDKLMPVFCVLLKPSCSQNMVRKVCRSTCGLCPEPKPIAIEKIKSLNSEEFNCPRRGVVQDPNNCTYFYICSPYGTFYHQRCPRGFNFDPVRLMCDFPERVPCYTNQSVDQND